MHQSPLEKEKLLMARLCWKAVSKSKMQILLLLFERSTHSAFLIRIANKVVKRCKFNSFVESFFCTFFCNFGGKGLNCISSLSSDRRFGGCNAPSNRMQRTSRRMQTLPVRDVVPVPFQPFLHQKGYQLTRLEQCLVNTCVWLMTMFS